MNGSTVNTAATAGAVIGGLMGFFAVFLVVRVVGGLLSGTNNMMGHVKGKDGKWHSPKEINEKTGKKYSRDPKQIYLTAASLGIAAVLEVVAYIVFGNIGK